MRVGTRVAVVCALALSLTACDVASNVAFDLTPKDKSPVDPTGEWDGRASILLVHRAPHGAWVVESRGRRDTQLRNCWVVYVGSLNGAELVTTSDLDLGFAGTFTRDQVGHYSGLFVELRGKRARVSGPEADDPKCPLRGIYVRK